MPNAYAATGWLAAAGIHAESVRSSSRKCHVVQMCHAALLAGSSIALDNTLAVRIVKLGLNFLQCLCRKLLIFLLNSLDELSDERAAFRLHCFIVKTADFALFMSFFCRCFLY